MPLFIFSEMLLLTTLFVLVAIPVEYAVGAEYESVRHFLWAYLFSAKCYYQRHCLCWSRYLLSMPMVLNMRVFVISPIKAHTLAVIYYSKEVICMHRL